MHSILVVWSFCIGRAVALVAVDANGGAASNVQTHQSQKTDSGQKRLTRTELSKTHPEQLLLGEEDHVLHDKAVTNGFHEAASQDGSMPYFVGSWSGYRNNWFGDVGYGFVPLKDFQVVSLGRHVHNETGLAQMVPVTLWSVVDKMPLAIVNVGPKSVKEGHYRWGPIDSPGVTVKKGREYRITQACTPGMADKWYDRVVSLEEIERNAATGYARFVGGVNESGFGFPENSNGQFRRPGMVNFKIKPPAVHGLPGQGAASHQAEVCLGIVALTLSFALARP